MKVLFVADKFPDARVEKSILSAMKYNFKVGIAYWGDFQPIFKEINQLPHWKYFLGTKEIAGLAPKRSIQSLREIAKDFSPDLIHAHDINNARIAIKLGIKVVFDDHEFWSEHIKYKIAPGSFFSLKKYRGLIGNQFKKFFYGKWEKEVISKSTIITVNPKIAEHHKQFSNHVYVLPNLPSTKEIEDLLDMNNITRDDDLTAYIGSDISRKEGKIRKMDRIPSIFEAAKKKLLVIGDSSLQSNEFIDSIGYVPHLEMYGHLMKATYGIIGWENHPFHTYCNPNKIYIYAHCGLVAILPPLIDPQGIKYFKKFNNYGKLSQIITNQIDVDPSRIISHAREHLIWEQKENILKEAYKITLT